MVGRRSPESQRGAYLPTMTSVALTATVTGSLTLRPMLLTEPSVIAATTSRLPTFTVTSAIACPCVIWVTVPVNWFLALNFIATPPFPEVISIEPDHDCLRIKQFQLLDSLAPKLHPPAPSDGFAFCPFHARHAAVSLHFPVFQHGVTRRTFFLHDLQRLSPVRRSHRATAVFLEQIRHDPSMLRFVGQHDRFGTAGADKR